MNNGEPVYSTVFNIVVDSVVRAVLMEVCGPQEEQHGLIWSAVYHSIVLYVGNDHIAGCKPNWVQTTLKTVVLMFNRVVLQTNPGKIKMMVCTPGSI